MDELILTPDEHIQLLLEMIRTRNAQIARYRDRINHLEKEIVDMDALDIQCCNCKAIIGIKRK